MVVVLQCFDIDGGEGTYMLFWASTHFIEGVNNFEIL